MQGLITIDSPLKKRFLARISEAAKGRDDSLFQNPDFVSPQQWGLIVFFKHFNIISGFSSDGTARSLTS